MAHIHYYFKDVCKKRINLPSPRLLYTGIVANDPEWFNIEHSHEFLEIEYVFRGKGTAKIGDFECSLSEGDLVIINPNTLHKEQSSSTDPLHFVFVAIDKFSFNQFNKELFIPNDTYPVIELNQYKTKFEQFFSELINESSSQIMFCTEICENLVTTILIFISRVLVSRNIISNLELSDDCKKVKEFIDSNYKDPLSLELLSKNLYISKYHLSRMFKNETGVSPIKYLINKRIDIAISLLKEDNYSISQIAEIVGYNDPIYFSQIFKKVMGVSPKTFRKNSK